MYFDSFSALLHMDGHGAFVWAAYGITLAVIVALVVSPLLKQRRFFIIQRMQLRRDQGRSPSSNPVNSSY